MAVSLDFTRLENILQNLQTQQALTQKNVEHVESLVQK